MNINNKCAYCTVITNDKYTPCIILNKKIMEYLNCKYPFIVLVTDSVPKETIDQLRENNIIIKKVQKFKLTHKDTMTWVKETVMIYSPLQLIQYEKILFFEADILLLENCDDLFNCYTSIIKPFYFYDDFDCDIFNTKYFKFPITEFYICQPNLFHYQLIFNKMLPYCSIDHQIASIFYYHCMHNEKRKYYIHFAGRKKPWHNIDLQYFYNNINNNKLIANLLNNHSIYNFVKIFIK